MTYRPNISAYLKYVKMHNKECKENGTVTGLRPIIKQVGLKMNSSITAVLSCLAFQMNNKIELCTYVHN